jgi:transcriptional regulator with XRE-family HTH domain
MKMKRTSTKRLNELQGGMTLRKFAERTGIGQSTLHNYLKGRDIPARMLIKICLRTGCTADWLLGLKEGKAGCAEVKLAGGVNKLKAIVRELQNTIKEMEG